MNERRHFFIKEHTLFSKGLMLVVSERWVRDGDRLLHVDPSSSDHSSTSFSSWLGLLNRGSLRAQSPQSAAGSHFGILSPTDFNSNWNWPKPSVAPGYIIVLCPPASAIPPLIYTGASLDWRLGRGSIWNTIQFSMSIVFVNVKTVLYQTIQFSVNTVSMFKAVPFQTKQFRVRKLFHFKQFSLA